MNSELIMMISLLLRIRKIQGLDLVVNICCSIQDFSDIPNTIKTRAKIVLFVTETARRSILY
jgi:hypothetical protein